jgi:pyruvate dehydrogenase E1 component alpha subunit
MHDQASMLALYREMARIRFFEEEIVARYRQQRMPTPVHLCLGQEACAAGVCLALEKDDQIFTTHRSHGHYLAKGGNMGRLAGELYGRPWGCSGGRGGSMHVCDPEVGVNGATSIVGGSIPLAVGSALGSWVRGDSRVSVAFFGDGATDEGVMHESLNFAALKNLPVIFVCENNFYATNSHREKRQAYSDIASLAGPYGVVSSKIDGNDAALVYQTSLEAVARARQGQGPTLIEAVTYRWKGHVGPECDSSIGCRCITEIDSWIDRCPFKAMRRILSDDPWRLQDHLDAIGAKTRDEILKAFDAAEAGDPPSLSDYPEGAA